MKFNRKKNQEEKSRLYLLVSMLFVLFISLILIENKTYFSVSEESLTFKDVPFSEEFIEEDFSNFERYAATPIQPQKTNSLKQPPEIDKSEEKVSDENLTDFTINPSDLFDNHSKGEERLSSEEIDDIPTIEHIGPVAYSRVSKAPVFKGCENYNTKEEQKKCMNNKIASLVSNKMSSHLSKNDDGVKIYVQFTVNELGEVEDVKTNSTSSTLNEKANKIIESLPVFTPAQHNNQKVKVIYSLPIFINVN